MNRTHLFLASLGMVAPLAAQEAVLPMPMLPPREPVSFILPAKAEAEQAIEIAEAAVNVRLAGALAETTVTLVFRNPNNRPMEGELSYPLPPDATLQGYALDIDGKMVDGVPVPKQKARVAFETEQRKGIDPGLAEWSGGNRFKTRVSPIPARGQRTVRLRYTTMVQQHGAATSYRLPLDFEKVGSFKLRIEALAPQQPQVQPSGLGNLAFTPWQNLFVLEREWKELALKEDLVIDLPQGMAEAPAVEKHGEQFCLAKLVAAPQAGEATLPTPECLELVWDASGSMERVDKAPILGCLRLYFAARADKPCTVRLTVVRDTVEPAREFRVEQGNATELLKALEGLSYDGATGDMAAAMGQDSPLRLLVTDGNVNFADAPPAPVKGMTYALVATSGVDKAALRRWGAIPLDLLRQTPQQALASVPAWQLAAVELDGQPWKEALSNAPAGVVEGAVLLTGTLPAGKHDISLLFRSASGEQRVNFSADTAGAMEGQLNRSFHAQNKLAALLLEPESPAREMLLRQLGEEYGIVTPGTSLLVLENLEQYLTHEVRPPACCSELRAAYDAEIAQWQKDNAEERKQAMEEQNKLAHGRRRVLLEWYETDYSKVKPQPPASGRPRAWHSVVAPTVIVSTGAAPASVAAVTVDERDEEAEEDGFFCEPEGVPASVELASRASGPSAPAPVPVEPQDDEAEGAEGAAPAPVVRQCVLEEGDEAEAPAAPTPSIRVQAWSSEAPYLAVLRAAADPVAAYAEQRRQYASTPGFYLDCADFFEQAGKRAMAVRVLSNLLEMEMENRSLMRAAAYKLRYMGEVGKAIILFARVKELFSEELQSYRDLALALADAGRWQEAADTMRQVLEHPMDERFFGMEQIAAVELARIVTRAQQAGKPVKLDGVDATWLKPIEADLRVVINWDTDMSDMDLWVIDPRNERCYYGHTLTRTGGRISRDVTAGYGPEEFLIRKALPGDYKVKAHYYGTSSMKMLAPVTLYAEVYTDYGRPNEKRQTLVFRLAGRDKTVDIASIAHTPDPAAPATRDYQVRAGDSWDSIALKELGSADRAAEIIALNPGAQEKVPPATGSIIRLPKK